MKKNSLNVRDLINAGLFSLLIIIFIFLSGMIGLIPVLMPAILFVTGLCSGPVMMLYSTKIKKRGMIFITEIVIALVFLATGHGIWILLSSAIGGLIAEIIIKKGNYSSVTYAKLAFLFVGTSSWGNLVPIYIARDKYIETLIEQGYGVEFAEKMMSVFPNWSFIPILLAGFLGTYIGCSLGVKMLKKHFVKAGMIKEL